MLHSLSKGWSVCCEVVVAALAALIGNNLGKNWIGRLLINKDFNLLLFSGALRIKCQLPHCIRFIRNQMYG